MPAIDSYYDSIAETIPFRSPIVRKIVATRGARVVVLHRAAGAPALRATDALKSCGYSVRIERVS